ncbi:hypothetical protein H6B33_08415 [Gemmiger formicilis]|uniref:DUF5682 family protein n=1 Tax=Gemmiger formicilis TaxID=745368 RepID=UPI001956865E|nr:DUF5682 family protein [Gemmiger formicilis]MBM6915426.1 hypothetical protein [Gemmiger formicilis]
MDTLLRGTEQAAVTPFSWEAPVLYYPVRHHSPACAWHLERAIERYAPDCILVEGPENANDLLPVLTSPDTKAPIALYYAWRDEEQRLPGAGEEPASFRCYYPFLDPSPELVALRAAAARGIPGRFIDLPYAQILLATQADRGLRAEEEKPNYASDSYLAANQFQKNLCEKAGLRDFEEFWEKYFETAGPILSTEAFVRQLNLYCRLARQSTPEAELRADGCLVREAHMARRIREAAAEYSRVLVVTGGFHVEGLLHPTDETPPPPPQKGQAVYPMRHSLPAADALAGYASGMPAPGFCTDIWAALHTAEPRQAWEQTVLDYLVRTGRRLRREGDTLSAYDETCAWQQARMLAQLRDKPAPGLYELRDAVLSSFVKGEADLSGSEPLRLLRELTTGKTVGWLCEGAPVPPLVQDFQAQCRAFRLKQQGAARQTVALSVFSSPRHREISRFFYRTDFLGCEFARREKGPDLRRRKDRNLIRETWEYRWSIGVETALIEHAVSGATVQEACASELRRRMAEAGRASEGADLLVQGFLMGLPEISTLTGRMEELLLADGDFVSLCEACASLNALQEWQSLYNEPNILEYPALLGRCFARILQMLPAMNTVDDHTAPGVQRACMLLYQITGRESFSGQRPPLLNAFERLVRQDPIHPALHGAVLGLLYGADPGWKPAVDRAVRGYLQGTRGRMLQSAAFLQGLFSTARDLLLTDEEFQRQIDGLICELPSEDFASLLPELRLAFSYFVPLETDRIARRAAAMHGAGSAALRRPATDAAAYARAEAVDAWAAARLDDFTGQGGEDT